jgi:hypothetical protein
MDVSVIDRSHFPDEVVSRALALLAVGYSTRKATAVLEREFGDLAPSRSAIMKWSASVADSVHEESGDRERRIIAQAVDLIAEGLEWMQGKPLEIANRLVALNAIAGTMRDKQYRRDTGANPQGPSVTIVINTGPQEIPAIEATVQHID